MNHTIEQYLTKLVGLSKSKNGPGFNLAAGDSIILTSIARQVNRGIALTDKQYSLVKEKLLGYRDQFEKNKMLYLDLALETLEKPLRSIDRSRTISVEDNKIVVKFPFNKKSIVLIEKIATKYRNFYSHEKGSNIHTFKMYEPLIHELISEFSKKEFDIDPFLMEMYSQIEEILSNELKYIPYVTENGLVNISEEAKKIAESEIGEFNENNMIKYWDRADRYGYRKVPRVFKNTTALAEHIANRHENKLYINPTAYTVEDISNALCELERFPLLVTLSRNKELEEIQTLVENFTCVAPHEQILLDRIEDKTNVNYPINQYIKDVKFNTWLDKNIKIVYIFKTSLPKLLVKGEWRPITHLSLNGEREQSVTASYISEHCDLSILHDSQRSYWSDSMSRQLNQWV